MLLSHRIASGAWRLINIKYYCIFHSHSFHILFLFVSRARKYLHKLQCLKISPSSVLIIWNMNLFKSKTRKSKFVFIYSFFLFFFERMPSELIMLYCLLYSLANIYTYHHMLTNTYIDVLRIINFHGKYRFKEIITTVGVKNDCGILPASGKLLL